jgi:hypothetical protein
VEHKYINFRGSKVRKEWYEAYSAGWNNPYDICPEKYDDEANAYEQGQIERRQTDCLEGTF